MLAVIAWGGSFGAMMARILSGAASVARLWLVSLTRFAGAVSQLAMGWPIGATRSNLTQ